MANFTGNVNFEGKTTNPRTTTALTAAATVNLNFSDPKAWTLAMNQPTTFNITGTFVNDDIVFIRVTGNFVLKFVQSGFTFEGTFVRQSDGVVTNYNGATVNNVALRCIDASTKTFEVVCNPNEAVVESDPVFTAWRTVGENFKVEMLSNLRVMRFGNAGLGYNQTTGEFGQMVQIQIAEAVEKGSVLSVSPAVDNKYIKQQNEYDAVCIAAESGSADAYIWVWKHGAICQVLMADGDAATRGYLTICSPTDGRATFIAVPSSNPTSSEHFKELGHCKESKTAGTNVLVLIDFHTL